ncbi:hypothetical protein DA798_04325 [Lactobacillus sp. PFC-70]|nr:hypothetical protein DA798_04325 [Lactobacillus sp. PFC-70]
MYSTHTFRKPETRYWLVAAMTLATLSVGSGITANAETKSSADESTSQVGQATTTATSTATLTSHSDDASSMDTTKQAADATTQDTTTPATTPQDSTRDQSSASSTTEDSNTVTTPTGATSNSEPEDSNTATTPANATTDSESEDTASQKTAQDQGDETPTTTPEADTDTVEDADAVAQDAAPEPENSNSTSPVKANAQKAAAPASATYSDSSWFNWQVDDATGTATITGATKNLSGAISIPPTYTVNGKTYQVTTIGRAAFAQSTNLVNGLTSVTFNQGLTTIEDSAFAYLDSLEAVDFSAATTLQKIGYQAFVSTKLTTLTLPDSVTTIGQEAFTYVPLTSVTLPAQLTSLGSAAFSSGGLQSVDLSHATQLTSIGDHVFENDQLTSVVIPANIQTIGVNAFAANHGLASLTFAPNSQLLSVGEGAFIYDGALAEVVFPDSVTTIGKNAFLSDTGLTQVTFGAGLTSIGDQAFTYDDQLTTADFTRATQLKTIGTGAFEYTGLHQALTLPTSVTTIGDFAFAGSQLTDLTLNEGLLTIGESAFSYNHLNQTLTIPKSVQTVGDRAFFGNELTAATILGDETVLGQDALSYNRITQLTSPSVTTMLADEQTVTHFTDSNGIHLNDLFTVNMGDQTEQNLVITNLSSETGTVSLVNGGFVVTEGTKRFNFDWTLPVNGVAVYQGHYTVVLDDPNIKVADSTIFVGTPWTPADNFVSAETDSGTSIPLDKLTVESNVDTSKAGKYTVTYRYGSEVETATVTVLKRLATLTLEGKQQVVYNGTAWTPDATQYYVDLPDGSRYQLQAGDLNAPTVTNVGDSPVTVTLSAAGIAHLNALQQADMYDWQFDPSEATFAVTPATVQVTVNSADKIAGQDDPTFETTVTGMPADGAALDYTVVREPGETPGTYRLTVDLGQNTNYRVLVTDGTLTIRPNQQTLTGQDYTMYVGDPTPTSADFGATATDVEGQPTDVMVDLAHVDLTTPQTYQVELSTADGQKLVVNLHVLANLTTPLTGQDYTMHVGDATPTAEDFQATATDKTGAALTPIVVDLTQADLATAGDYAVTLSVGDQQIKVWLHVLAASTGGETPEEPDPGNPGDGGNPEEPDPGNPGDGGNPEEPDPGNPGDGGNPGEPDPGNPGDGGNPETPDPEVPGDGGNVVDPDQPIDGGNGDTSVAGPGNGATDTLDGEQSGRPGVTTAPAAGSQVTLNQQPQQGAQPAKVTTLANQATSTQRLTTQTASTTTQAATPSHQATTLPQTGEQKIGWAAVLGLLLGSLGLAGHRRVRRHQD